MNRELSPWLVALLLLGAILLAVASLPALAADRYVLDGGTSSTCLSWSDACDQVSTAEALIARGETIWVGDGTYGAVTFDVAADGTTPIYVTHATASAHGTDTGWSAAYGDGQAIFTGAGTVLTVESPYWVIDGVSRTTATSGHGIVVQMANVAAGSVYGVHLNQDAASNTTLRYVEIYHADPCTAYAGDYKQDCLRSAGTGADNVTVQYCYLHDAPTNLIITANASDWTVEYSYFANAHSSAANHGQAIYMGLTAASGWTVRYNTFKNINGSAVIFLKDTVADTKVYGNVFWEDSPDNCGDTSYDSTGALIGSNTTSITGLRVYNNTIVNLSGRGTASDDINLDAGSDNIADNNIWYGTTPAFTNCTDGGKNDVNVSDPTMFASYAGGIFTLTRSTTAGDATIGATYAQDALGSTRGADGVWDRGAFEYNRPRGFKGRSR